MDSTVVNVGFSALAFAIAFGIARTVMYIRAKRRMKLARGAEQPRVVPGASEPRNRKKRRRLEQVAARQTRTAQRAALKESGRRSG